MLDEETFLELRKEFNAALERTNCFERPDSDPPRMPFHVAFDFTNDIVKIVRIVACHSNLNIQQIVGPRKIPKIVRWRNLAMHVAYDYCTKDMYEISKIFGYRDRTTITHGVKRFKELMEVEPEWRRRRDLVVSQL